MAHTTSQPLTADSVNTVSSSIASLIRPLGVVGAIAMVVALVLSATMQEGWARFLYSYTVSYSFVLSMCVGAIFFITLQHLTRAGWSALVRRQAEILTFGFFPLAVLCLPLVLSVLGGNASLMIWNSPEAVASNALLQHKTPYLNTGFYLIRFVVYFIAWIGISRLYISLSARQDVSANPKNSLLMEKLSAPSLFILALTVTFASIDLLMALEPIWFSTIFGVYYFAASMVAFFSILTISTVLLQRAGYLTKAINAEHYHDIGKLLFGFNCFWGYIAFSQYILIWYANIPEETQWYLARQENGWEYIAIILIVGHFVIPFLGLLSRNVKRNPDKLLFWACWLLVMGWIDMYYLGMNSHAPSPVFGLIDIAILVGIACLALSGVLSMAYRYRLIAVGDPRLQESINFHNL